jgi:phage-related protein
LGSAERPFQQPNCKSVFCFTEGRLVALHGIIKKTQKTPQDDLDLARKRKREFQ